jgi:hypothetical protein
MNSTRCAPSIILLVSKVRVLHQRLAALRGAREVNAGIRLHPSGVVVNICLRPLPRGRLPNLAHAAGNGPVGTTIDIAGR